MSFVTALRPRWPFLAAAWWALYATLVLSWIAGADGWPYAVGRPAAQAGALLVGLSATHAAPVVLGVSVAVAALCLVLGLRRRRSLPVVALTWCAAIGIALVVTDARLLLAVFQLLTGHAGALTWPVGNQALCLIGALLAAAAARSGRRPRRPAAERPVWAGAALVCAVGAPVGYAAIRAAWALGLPVGATAEFLEPYTAPGARVTEAVIAAAAIGGALLTVGLVRPWGDRVPGWFPVIGGRPLPPLTAVVPAVAVALMLSAAGLSLSRGLLAMALGITPATESARPENWGAWIAAPLWTLWGLGLAATAIAYHRRRRSVRHHDRSTA